jgi:hypothetical protein
LGVWNKPSSPKVSSIGPTDFFLPPLVGDTLAGDLALAGDDFLGVGDLAGDDFFGEDLGVVLGDFL